MSNIQSFVKRLDRLGIKVELQGNFPWLYLYKINGKLVKEKHFSEYGFTVFLQDTPTDIGLIFKTIRKYL